MDYSAQTLGQVLERVAAAPELMSCFERDDVARVQQAAAAIRDVRELAARLPAEDSPQAVRDFLGDLVTRIRSMRQGESIVIPAGWFKGPERSRFFLGDSSACALPETISRAQAVAADLRKDGKLNLLNTILLVVTLKPSPVGMCTFAVINMDEGLEYHPVSYMGSESPSGKNPPQLHHQFAFQVDNVPVLRVQDSWLWYLIYRLLLSPQTFADMSLTPAQALYERLLPALNNRPLYWNTDPRRFAFEDAELTELALTDEQRLELAEDDDDDVDGDAAARPAVRDDEGIVMAPAVKPAAKPATATAAEALGKAAAAVGGLASKAKKAMQKVFKRGAELSEEKMLSDNLGLPSLWATRPVCGDPRRSHLLLEAVRFLCLASMGPAKADHVMLCVRWELCRAVERDLALVRPNGFTASDRARVAYAVQRLCAFGGQRQFLPNPVTTLAQLGELVGFATRIDEHATRLRDVITNANVKNDAVKAAATTAGDDAPWETPVVPPELSFGKQDALVPYPLFDRLDNREDVERFAGAAPEPTIYRPIEFTLVPDVCRNYNDVQLALRHCDHLCTLMSYQTETIKNTFLHRVSFIQHVFTRVIPLPLPGGHPHKAKHDFWVEPLRYSDQVRKRDFTQYSTCFGDITIYLCLFF